MSSARLLRSIAAATSRDVIRITDDRARDASGTITIAYEGATRWLVRLEANGRHASVRETIARPGRLDAVLASAVVRLLSEVAVSDAAATAAVVPESPRAREPFGDADESLYIAWADEILDPFAGMPSPPRREVAIYSEVIDPFAPPAARRLAWSEVLDPWGR